MTTVPIRLFGDPVLRTPADPVTDFDKELRQLVQDLEDTMLAAPGAGLAAPQIGVSLRVFTYHVDDEQAGHLVNPVLHFPDDEMQDGDEGCLSIPGLSFDCRRRANVVAHGQNRVTRDLDPTAHAEIQAIRAACREVGDFSLEGMTLYASCEPCPMCIGAALWARLDRVVYAADREDAARGGFDDRWFHDLFAVDRAAWPMRVEALRVGAAVAPFEAWAGDTDRIPY